MGRQSRAGVPASHYFGFRVTDAERRAIDLWAARQGLTAGDAARLLLLDAIAVDDDPAVSYNDSPRPCDAGPGGLGDEVRAHRIARVGHQGEKFR